MYIDNSSGLISSAMGSINIGVGSTMPSVLQLDTAPSSLIAIADEGGLLRTPLGAVNIGSVQGSMQGALDIVLSGGAVQSPSINFTASGTVHSYADQYTGTVNAAANAAYIGAANGQLDLGNICLKGDPCYYNDKGSVVLHGSLTANERISIYSAGSISSSNWCRRSGVTCHFC